MAIIHRIKPKFNSRSEQIVARLRESTGAAAPIDPQIKLKRLVAEASTVMALIHGGDWKVQIDHEIGYVLVSRRLSHQSNSR